MSMNPEQPNDGGAPGGWRKRRRMDEADGQELTETEGKAYTAMLQAKWKSALAKDSIGMTGDRLIQFGDLASEILEEVISALRLSWPMVSPEDVRNNLEAFHSILIKKNVGVGHRIILGKRLAVLIAADVILGVREAAAEEAAAAVAAEEAEGAAGGSLPSDDNAPEDEQKADKDLEEEDIETVLESSEAEQADDKEGDAKEEESDGGGAEGGSDDGAVGGGGGIGGGGYLPGALAEPTASGGATNAPRGLETPVQSLPRPASPAPDAPGPSNRTASRLLQYHFPEVLEAIQRNRSPRQSPQHVAGPQLAADDNPHVAAEEGAEEGELSGGAHGGVETAGDDSSLAAQHLASAGPSGHRPRRAATATAAAAPQTMPPRKPSVAAKAKAAPASAPSERRKARAAATTPVTFDAAMTRYLAPEDAVIKAETEAERAAERRAAAKSAAAAKFEAKAESTQRSLQQATAEYEDLCYRLVQAEKERDEFAEKVAEYENERAKLLSEAQAAAEAAREKAEKVAEAKEEALRKVRDIEDYAKALKRRYS